MADADPLATLGMRLRRVRVRRDLSLRAMARRLQISSHGTLVDYEHGRRLIPADLFSGYLRQFPDEAAELGRLRDAVLLARADQVTGESTSSTHPIAQLPGDLADFVGREAELKWLDDCLGRPRTGPAVVTVVGSPGIGKSSLAVHLAHRVADDYGDGQLFVELRGAQPQPPSARQVLRTVLVSLGVAESDLPPGCDERAALYRSTLYGKRILVVLDDAADEEQVRPLLPGHSDALVLVTARGPLAGLDAAYRLPLEGLAPDAALELFSRVVGADRVSAEPEQGSQIVAHCACLPLATRLAAAGIATWPHGRLRDWAEDLADRSTRLDRLQVGDRAVSTVFDTAYEALTPPVRTLFRRLSLLPGPDFGVRAIQALCAGNTESALAELTRRGLVQAAATARRYRLHDLLLLFAEQRLAAEEDPATRDSVERAVLAHLLGSAFDAGSTLDPSGYSVPGPHSPFGDRRCAVRWLDAERHGLLPAVRRAAQLRLGRLVFPLLVSLPWYWDLRCHWEDWQEVNEHALALAEQVDAVKEQVIALNGLSLVSRMLGDPATAAERARKALVLARKAELADEEAGALDRLGFALSDLGDHTAAADQLEQAARLNEKLGERWSQAAATRNLGEVLKAAGRHDEAATNYWKAAALFGELGASRSRAMALCGYADVQVVRGTPADAVAQYQLAAGNFESQDDHWGLAYARLGLGKALAAQGRPDRAVAELTRAAEVFKGLGDTKLHTEALRVLDGAGRAP